MANNRIIRYIGAIAVGTVLMVVPSCTDTWDDHYGYDPSSGVTQTLWDLISSNPEYSRFADIVRHSKYYKDNTHDVPTYTYEDVLKSTQVTVWVPSNSVFTEEEYQKWLQMCESEDKTQGYNVQQQFLGNHIALWRHNISAPGVDTVKMINGKNLEFDKGGRTLEGLELGEEYNVPAVNGVLHSLKGIAPFRYNFYETLKYKEPMTKFGKYVVGKDTTYFNAGASIEGVPDEYGHPTYVDSVYTTSNRLFEWPYYLPDDGAEKWQMYEEGFGARINNEDSVFVMIMPNDAAWDAAVALLEPSHLYAKSYVNKEKGNLGTTERITFTDEEVDSIKKMSIEMDIISPLVFNIHKQPKRINGTEMWTIESFKEYKGDCGNTNPKSPDYLLNTFMDTLRNVGDWDKTSLFDGEAIEMSNGLAYEVSSWNFPKEYYTPDVEVEVENSGVFYNIDDRNNYKLGYSSKRYSFSNENFKDLTELYGSVSRNDFYHLVGTSQEAVPKVEIKLKGNNPNAYVPNAEVMSGKYDIQVVLVPHWYIDVANASRVDNFYLNPGSAEMTNLFATNKYKFTVTVRYCDGKSNSDQKKTFKDILSDGVKVDTVTVGEMDFPFSYKNMRFAYPTLIIEGSTGSKDVKNGYRYDLVIDKIILRRKD